LRLGWWWRRDRVGGALIDFSLTRKGAGAAQKWVVPQTHPEMEREFDAATPVVIDAMNARVMELLGPIAD
jgi:hypothetical protein